MYLVQMSTVGLDEFKCYLPSSRPNHDLVPSSHPDVRNVRRATCVTNVTGESQVADPEKERVYYM